MQESQREPTDRERRRAPDDPIRGSEEAIGQPSEAQVTDEIANDLMAIHQESYGRSARRVVSRMMNDTLVVMIEDIELLPNEEFLVSQGRQDAVSYLRSEYQKAIEPTFRAAVERATGRRVTGFASLVQFEEPRFVVEIFRLEPS